MAQKLWKLFTPHCLLRDGLTKQNECSIFISMNDDNYEPMERSDDYNVFEEEQVWQDQEGNCEEDPKSGEIEDQLLDMMMEDRIGGTGVEDFDGGE